MTLIPRISREQSLYTGEYTDIFDITGAYSVTDNPGGYGAPNPTIGSITRTRFIFCSYLTEQYAEKPVFECLPGVQYEVYGSGSNTVVVDSKTYTLGDIFILQVQATPSIGDGLFLKKTGKFAALTKFVPTKTAPVYSSQRFVPSECGIDTLIFPDSTYQCVYELYGQAFSAGAINAGTYLVSGVYMEDTAVISGVTYNVGEVVIIPSNTTFTGTADLNAFIAESEPFNYPLYYYAWQSKINIEDLYVSDSCTCRGDYALALSQIQSMLEAIDINFDYELNNDFSGTQTLLYNIQRIAEQVVIQNP